MLNLKDRREIVVRRRYWGSFASEENSKVYAQITMYFALDQINIHMYVYHSKQMIQIKWLCG